MCQIWSASTMINSFIERIVILCSRRTTLDCWQANWVCWKFSEINEFNNRFSLEMNTLTPEHHPEFVSPSSRVSLTVYAMLSSCLFAGWNAFGAMKGFFVCMLSEAIKAEYRVLTHKQTNNFVLLLEYNGIMRKILWQPLLLLICKALWFDTYF